MDDINIDALYLTENVEDECWEIREKDAILNHSDSDAVVAKFYYAPQLACMLLNFLRFKK